MKKIIAKFKISRALDAGQPVPGELRREANRSSGVGDFLERAETVDRLLKRGKAEVQSPTALHGSIMRAIAQARPMQPEPRPMQVRWIPAAATAMVMLLLLGVLWGLRLKQQGERTAKAESLAVAAQALQMGNELAQSMPAKMIAPVSGELDKVHQDVDTTARYLLACIP